ncbi:hypothetical protein XENORESO_013424 [Xenotaenia resolanae]|uniref:Uncharacterized protein n=1 Tax=Xenotaenia resolanae TaxID=208358 RepID=A0ABV0WUU2_9TELE
MCTSFTYDLFVYTQCRAKHLITLPLLDKEPRRLHYTHIPVGDHSCLLPSCILIIFIALCMIRTSTCSAVRCVCSALYVQSCFSDSVYFGRQVLTLQSRC